MRARLILRRVLRSINGLERHEPGAVPGAVSVTVGAAPNTLSVPAVDFSGHGQADAYYGDAGFGSVPDYRAYGCGY